MTQNNSEHNIGTDWREYIDEQINDNDVVLFMKGSMYFPQCGFSSVVVSILQKLGVEFKDIDVLSDLNLRQSIKEYSDWPTIPQLYIKGNFVGGCDIIKEMYQNGELKSMMSENNIDMKTL